MHAWKPLTREAKFMEPWNASTERDSEKPAQKLTTAAAESVPLAPCVRIIVGCVEDMGVLCTSHSIGFLTRSDSIVKDSTLLRFDVSSTSVLAVDFFVAPVLLVALERAFVLLNPDVLDLNFAISTSSAAASDDSVDGVWTAGTRALVDERVARLLGPVDADSMALRFLGGMVCSCVVAGVLGLKMRVVKCCGVATDW